MKPDEVICWGGGFMAVSGGVLLGLGQLLTALGKRRGNHPRTRLGEIIVLFANTALIFGMMGLYARQLGSTGALGLIGFVCAVGGSMGLSPSAGLVAEIVPAAKEAIVTGTSRGFGLALNIVPAILFVVGYVLFGIVTATSGVFPRAAGGLMVLGAVLLFLGAGLLRVVRADLEPGLGPWLRGSGGLLIGAGIAWAGFSLLRTPLP